MKRVFSDKTCFFIAPGTYLVFALMTLLIPLRWLLAWVSSIVFHELFHILALGCLDKHIYSIHIGIDGVKINTPQMSLREELVCAMAGPFGGLLLMFTARWMPVLSLCSGFLTFYNLLPLYPQDGGRALWCVANLLFGESWAKVICNIAEYLCLVGVCILGFYGTFVLKVGIFPTILVAILIQRCRKKKNTLQRD